MLALVALMGGAVCASQYFAKNLLYQRSRIKRWNPKFHPIQFHNGLSFILDSPHSHGGSNSPILIFSHGNSGTILMLNHIREFCKRNGYGLIVYDYYGYGASEDVPTIMMNENFLYMSIDEVYHWICDRYPDSEIVLMGESLGCHPTCWLAAQNYAKISKVILCVPFDCLGSIIGYGNYLVGDLNNLKLCSRITCPVIIFSALHDHLMPQSCGINIARALRGEKVLIKIRTGHNDYFIEDVQNTIVRFLSM